ncbi:unnamed protein product [Cuscuta epithymum]|uniref:X8 domain-containing protein n=1 Tax=Cuscuta epithymum TaxID=186058 RepID=A0AAV0CQ08_9ASTE|nr:unnamed protein product [Cuscuta epithymum]
MKAQVWVFLLGFLLLLQCCHVTKVDARIQRRRRMESASALPDTTTHSPPEGNTTFLGGTTWCVARGGASQFDLQVALDWACSQLGPVECGAIKPGGPCFEPNTLLSHASYAFNSYYQQNGNNDAACYFGGAATLTGNNPSYETCTYATSGHYNGDMRSSEAARPPMHKENIYWWQISSLLMLLYLRS